MFDWIFDPQAWIAFSVLAALEIVLGIDNILFISILVGRLPQRQRNRARVLGLVLAMATRLALLFTMSLIMRLTDALFTVNDRDVSGRDLILGGGGLFLLWKAAIEIHRAVEGGIHIPAGNASPASYGSVLAQIAVLDVVFSLDSVITAVGMVDQLAIMAAAIVVSVGIMLFAARPLGDFIERHPTLKMLALCFLILVGMVLIADAFELHIPKGYVYFAMGFSVAVEMLNLRARKKRTGRA
jgi:predicted tellurium resistance membrane protein TerC